MNEYANHIVQAGVTNELLNKLRTGNPIVDTFISLVVMGSHDLVREMINGLKDLLRQCPVLLYRMINFVLNLRRQYIGSCIAKTCIIKSISDDKHVNTIYPAVSWYINQQVTPEEQPMLNISANKEDQTPQQQPPEYQQVKFKFQGYTIKADRAKELIKIYADREYTRENEILTLSADNVDSKKNLFMELVKYCQEQYGNRKSKWEQLIYRNDNGKWISKPSRTRRQIDTVVLKNGQMDEIVADMDEFLKSEDWYVARDVPYTRRYLFYGTPGTGKSSAIKALACRSKKHIHYLVLSDIKSDSELFRLLEQITFSDTIVVIEDIDCSSDKTHSRVPAPPPRSTATSHNGGQDGRDERGREQEGREQEGQDGDGRDDKKGESFTLSGLLNAIDGGMLDSHGQILISTTNHIEVLDNALIRSGRINQRYDFQNCSADQIHRLYQNFFDTNPAEIDIISDKDAARLSPADVTESFLLHKNNPAKAWRALLTKLNIDCAYYGKNNSTTGCIETVTRVTGVTGVTGVMGVTGDEVKSCA